MTKRTNETTQTGSHQGNGSHHRRRWIVNIVLSIALIAAGIAGAAYISKTAPKARKRPPVKPLPLVRVIDIHPKTERILVPAMGSHGKGIRSEERRVGKECRSRGSPYH